MMELSLLLLLGAAALSAKYLWERKCLLRPLTDYWLFWGFSLYLFLDALGALAPADWALSYEKYRVVGLMAVLTLLGALLLDSREAIDRVFATLALAAVAAALLSVLGRMGPAPSPRSTTCAFPCAGITTCLPSPSCWGGAAGLFCCSAREFPPKTGAYYC